jgi:hypothetical protein
MRFYLYQVGLGGFRRNEKRRAERTLTHLRVMKTLRTDDLREGQEFVRLSSDFPTILSF